MRFSSLAKRFSTENLVPDLVAASAAGLVAACFTIAVRVWFRDHILVRSVLWYLFLALFTYTLIALVLTKLWAGKRRRFVPGWLLIGAIGSLMFVAARLVPGIIGGWLDPLTANPSFTEYIFTEIEAATDVLLFYWVLTIPVAGVAYYAASVVKIARKNRLHSGTL